MKSNKGLIKELKPLVRSFKTQLDQLLAFRIEPCYSATYEQFYVIRSPPDQPRTDVRWHVHVLYGVQGYPLDV
jgi:hypothetical protein